MVDIVLLPFVLSITLFFPQSLESQAVDILLYIHQTLYIYPSEFQSSHCTYSISGYDVLNRAHSFSTQTKCFVHPIFIFLFYGFNRLEYLGRNNKCCCFLIQTKHQKELISFLTVIFNHFKSRFFLLHSSPFGP